MNSLPSAKYKETPNEIEKSSLNSESSREKFNFFRLKKIKEEKIRQEKFTKTIYERKKIEVKISTQSRRRSTSARFTTIEKRFTRKILQEQC